MTSINPPRFQKISLTFVASVSETTSPTSGVSQGLKKKLRYIFLLFGG